MARGRPRKRTRNISGLRNQGPRSSIPQLLVTESLARTNDAEPPDSSLLDRPKQELALNSDTNTVVGGEDAGKELIAEVEEAPSCGDWENGGMQEGMVKLAVNGGDDLRDEDWLPYQLKNTKRLETERPKKYAKGPDVMSKSKRTQRRHRKGNRNQKTLDAFMFSTREVAQGAPRLPPSSAGHDVQIHSELAIVLQENVETQISPASVATSAVAVIPQVTGRGGKSKLEDDHLDEGVQGGGVKIRGWNVLREQIEKEMKTRSHTLPLSQVNQLLILRNFATLRLKGYEEMDACLAIAGQWDEGEDSKHYAGKVQALARHYQVLSSCLLEEKMSCSFLHWLFTSENDIPVPEWDRDGKSNLFIEYNRDSSAETLKNINIGSISYMATPAVLVALFPAISQHFQQYVIKPLLMLR